MDPVTIVLGLGNPGQAYRSTRHNLGFRAVDELAERHGAAFHAAGELRRYAWLARVEWSGREVLLAKPRTFMNRSGRAAAALCRAFEVAPSELIVVHDDADLSLGRLRVRRGGGAGGHNGIRSLIEVSGVSDFLRVRLGVRGTGREETDLADYVLAPFRESERPVAEALARLGADAVESLLRSGLEETMNQFNGIDVGTDEDDSSET